MLYEVITTLVLTVDDMNVTGAYLDPETAVSNIIEGTISEDGKVLSGTWIQEGPFELTLSDDATYFNGTFGFNGIANTTENT